MEISKLLPYNYRFAALKLPYVGVNKQLVPHGMFQTHSHTCTHGQHHYVVLLEVRSQYTVAMPMTGSIVRWQLVFVLQQRHEGCSNPSLVMAVVQVQ